MNIKISGNIKVFSHLSHGKGSLYCESIMTSPRKDLAEQLKELEIIYMYRVGQMYGSIFFGRLRLTDHKTQIPNITGHFEAVLMADIESSGKSSRLIIYKNERINKSEHKRLMEAIAKS